MFDFSVSQNQRRRPRGRIFVSAVASCLIHLLILVVLIENPWLLHGGMYHQFRGLMVSPDKSESLLDDDGDYRTIAVLRPMTAPSAATLKKYTYDWEQTGNEEKAPPVQVRWGDEQQAALSEDAPASPLVGDGPESLSEDGGAAPKIARIPDSVPDELAQMPDSAPPESAGATPESISGGEEAVSPGESTINNKVAVNIAPEKIPDTIPQPEDESISEDVNIFEDEQQAIDRQGSGLFNTKGFPLGEYASLIKKKVTGNWYIPSNLRDSDGYTTIVFFIDRNGQHFGTRIVESSGNNSLNITALNAIINSNPFPPLPQGFPGDHVGVKYIFIPEPQ